MIPLMAGMYIEGDLGGADNKRAWAPVGAEGLNADQTEFQMLAISHVAGSPDQSSKPLADFDSRIQIF